MGTRCCKRFHEQQTRDQQTKIMMVAPRKCIAKAKHTHTHTHVYIQIVDSLLFLLLGLKCHALPLNGKENIKMTWQGVQ